LDTPFKIISKEKYILNRVTALIKSTKGEKIDKNVLNELIEQWSFDYEMEKEYRPEVLR
jgi:hypothetical protein